MERSDRMVARQPRLPYTNLRMNLKRDMALSACPRCRNIPWAKPANSDYRIQRRIIPSPDPRERLKSSSCRICWLLADIKHPSLYKTYYDATFKCDEQIILPYFNLFPWLQECVSYCHRAHNNICIRGLFPPASRLRVIDCKHPQRIVIFAPTVCKYAALSYVWGNDPIPIPSQSSFSQVVVDAIEVTLLMKLQYLWVDRHCIDQSDEDKHHQISQMGNVYANAEITIIAAAGTNPTYGLPGISRPRARQLDTTGPELSDQLKASVWASRGWTYQEGFLSPRRLIFTDYEVSYLCDTIGLAEHDKEPRDIIASDRDHHLKSFMLPYFKYDTVIDSIDNIYEVIMEYSRRQLGYPLDALRAINGVIRLLEIKNFTLIWGIPIHRNLPAIHWYHEHPTKRRLGFPSWSFLGWDGPIKMYPLHSHSQHGAPFEVSLGDGENLLFDGNPIGTITTKLKGLGENTPRYLHLTGFTVNLPLENIQQTEPVQSSRLRTIGKRVSIDAYSTAPSSGIYATLEIRPGLRMKAKTNIDESNFTTCNVLGFILGNDSRTNIPTLWKLSHAHLLLLRPSGTCYERIGCLGRWPSRQHLPSIMNRYAYFEYFIESDDVSDIIEFPKTPLWLEEAEKKTIVVG